MKKSSNKGFILLETLIVSTFVVSILIFIYVQLINIKRNYDDSFKINTVQGLYDALELKEVLNQNDYNNLITSLNNSSFNYVDVNESYMTNTISSNKWTTMITYLNIKQVLFVDENITNFKNNLNNTVLDNDFKDYIKKIAITDGTKYRFIIKYNNDTYTSIVLD